MAHSVLCLTLSGLCIAEGRGNTCNSIVAGALAASKTIERTIHVLNIKLSVRKTILCSGYTSEGNSATLFPEILL